MLVPVQARAPARSQRVEPRAGHRRAAPVVPLALPGSVLELQRTVGNRTVAGLLRPVLVRRQPEHPPIKDIYAKGTLDAAAWETTHQQAKAALDKGDAAKAEPLYVRLLTDAATVAGITVLPGFDPTKIHVIKGTVEPGLNLSLDSGDDPGHVGWVDAGGTLVALDFAKGIPAVKVALTISPGAFKDEKAMSMRTIRHEMLHARHRQITMTAVTTWHNAGRKQGFEDWVANHAKVLGLSAADVVLVQKGARGGSVNTEVLAYVEGFMTEYHLTKPTRSGTAMAFFELLGMVETKKFLTWQQADQKVRDEAMARLEGYYGTLGKDHQARWKEWVSDGVAKSSGDKTGRKEFFAALAVFVR